MRPIRRLTLFAPRTVDPDEATVLTPAAGAPHSLPFQLTTQEGVANWLPLLVSVTGRSGGIDVRTRKYSIGSYTARLLDAKVARDNLVRFLTAFTGNADGRPLLLGVKAFVEESYDLGVTFDPYIVGRCTAQSIDDILYQGLAIRGFEEDLRKFKLFAYRSIASNAIEPLVFPPGLSADYGNAEAAEPMSGEIGAAAIGPYRNLELDGRSRGRSDNIVTKALLEHVGGMWFGRLAGNLFIAGTSGVGVLRIPRSLRLRFSAPSLGIIDKELHIRRLYTVPRGAHNIVTRVLVDVLRRADDTPATDDPFYVSLATGTIPNGTDVTFSIRALQFDGPSDTTGELYFSDRNVAEHWRDACDGDLGSRRYQSGDTLPTGRALGDPVYTIPYDSDAFDDLITPLAGREALPILRGRVTKAVDAFEYFEKRLCQPYGLAYRFEPAVVSSVPISRLKPLDLRLPSVTALGSVPTLDDDDLNRDAPIGWKADALKAITTFKTWYYTDIVIDIDELEESSDRIPALPASLLVEARNYVLDLGFGRFLDLDDQPFEVDATGIRGSDLLADVIQGQQTDAWAENQAKAVGEHFRPFFADGATEVSFTCRRSSATARALREGDYCIGDFSPMPNPSTNQRGGPRLYLLTRREDQDLDIVFTALDAGLSSGAGVPTVGTPTQQTGNTHHGISVAITLNGSGAPAVVRVAIKPTAFGATPPNADDAAWIPVARVEASATINIGNLPSGKRVFVDANSRPHSKAGVDRELPSAYAVPSGTKYVDTAAYNPPTAATVTPSTVTSTDPCDLTWTPGETSLPTVVYLDDGSTERLLIRLPAGTMGPFNLLPYVLPGESYTVSVAHEDALGTETSRSSDTVTIDSGATGPALTTPTGTLILGS